MMGDGDPPRIQRHWFPVLVMNEQYVEKYGDDAVLDVAPGPESADIAVQRHR